MFDHERFMEFCTVEKTGTPERYRICIREKESENLIVSENRFIISDLNCKGIKKYNRKLSHNSISFIARRGQSK